MSNKADDIIFNQCILALDLHDEVKLQKLLLTFQNKIQWVKVGMELFYHRGHPILEMLTRLNFKIFLDLKLYDIPNTIQRAVAALAHYQFDMITLHLQGGSAMIAAAQETLSKLNHPGHILGVTVLTSFDEEQWKNVSNKSISDSVDNFLRIAKERNIYGVVCSALEIDAVKKLSNLKTIVPGLRWQGSSQDQKRVQTPAWAVNQGVDYLVIGRELTQADDPLSSLKSLRKHFNESIS